MRELKFNSFDNDELIYNHIGEHLFFFTYHPDEIRIFTNSDFLGLNHYDEIKEKMSDIVAQTDMKYAIKWSNSRIYYCARGVDCDGVPFFDHYTMDQIAAHYRNEKEINRFEPLTVGIVRSWIGWFLYHLENSHLIT